MKVIAKKNRELALINAQNTQNENRAEIITLVVPEEYEDYNKKIVFITSDGNVWDVITNNEYKITNAITKYKQVDFYIWLTKEVDGESIDFRTKTKTLNFYHNVDASDEITDEEIHGVNTVVNLLEEEIEKVENLDIEATKVGSTTTVTITKKDGTTESVEINDGVDGQDGQDGYTPQKGIDYFTEQDIEEIETDVKNDLEENVLVNYSLIAETGAKIELSINPTDYKLKAILKDKNNNIIHTSNVIDLPLETMVVNATYDNVNKVIILTLQNGTTVSISVADLVSGLVSESQLQTILSNYYTKTEINNLLNNKVDKVQGKELSSNDFTDTLKEKLEGLENYDDTEIKADISDIQDEQTEQDEEIEKLQTENARLKATLPTTGEVTGQDITLNKTAELEFIKPPLPMGNTKQNTTEGYNLYFMDYTDATNSWNGLTIKSTKTGYIINGTCTQDGAFTLTVRYMTLLAGTYTIAIKKASGLNNIGLSRENYSSIVRISKGNTKATFTLEETTKVCLTLVVENTKVYNEENEIMIYQGTTEKPWEEYTNGASPNPDYPQEITNVTGDVEVKVQNKNLIEGSQDFSGNWLNASFWETDNSTYNGLVVKKRKEAWVGLKKEIKIVAGKTYTFSCYIKSDTPRLVGIYLNGGTSTVSPESLEINTTTNWSRYSLTFTATTSGTVPPRIENTSYSDTNYTYICGYQLEEGSTSTPYTPDKEQVLPLTLGNIELCKIGDYQDYFYKESNKWYLHKEIGKVVYDGTETGASHYWYVQDENNHSYQITDTTIHLKESKKGLCNYFIINNSGDTPYLYPILQTGTSYCRFVTYNITGLTSTLEEWKTWLSTHNIIFYYPLATPTDTEITDTTLILQLEAINNAISYEEQTNISSNTIALFNVEAYQSTKLVLQDFATAIVALGGV